jgi:hypothetical protein
MTEIIGMHSLKSVKYKEAEKAKNTNMSRTKLLLGLVLTIIFSMAQVGKVLAAPASQEATPISGEVQSITLESDPTTGVMTVLVDLRDSAEILQTIRVSQETAINLGIVLLDEDGNPIINEMALGETVDIDPTTVIPDQQEPQHPVGNALATFFSDIEGVDYASIMSAHQDGVGFGVIAQALWVTSELGGDSQLFQDLLYAKQHNDYSAFSDITEDGTAPKSWGQLRKALLTKENLGMVMSNHGNNGNQGNENGNNKDKDKSKDKNNNGNGNHNNGNGNGPSQ